MPTSRAAGTRSGELDHLRSLDRVDRQRRLQAEDRIEAELAEVVAGAAQPLGDPLDDRPAAERLHLGEEGLPCILRAGLDAHRAGAQARRQRHARRRDLQPRGRAVLGRAEEVPDETDRRGDQEHGEEHPQPPAVGAPGLVAVGGP
jgi:hypothetical protein